MVLASWTNLQKVATCDWYPYRSLPPPTIMNSRLLSTRIVAPPRLWYTFWSLPPSNYTLFPLKLPSF